ncbi:MAG: 50S ribosomal protein L18 [Robiginitomaculum sp.]
MKTVRQKMKNRAARVRRRLKKNANGQARLSVFRSNKNISAQIIDDAKGVTLAFASTLEKAHKGKGSDAAAASAIGKLIGERAVTAGVKDVIFDRGGYLYHGRVKALAVAAREAGLKF